MVELRILLAEIVQWEIGLAFAISALGARAALSYSRRRGLIDIPNYRSSHAIPTPRGGGIGIVAAVLVAAGLETLRNPTGFELQLAAVAAAIILLAAVGWVDDHGSASITLRFSIHVASGLAVALLVNRLAPAPGWLNVAWLGGWLFWSVASINIVNFMDGIDGMVAAQGLVYGAYIAALCGIHSFAADAGLILFAACAGFLLWNWAPARIFMGDVGSGPIGLLFATCGALALPHASAALVFLPLLPLYLDALMTMWGRARRGERLTQAHRSHLYQRIANGQAGHARVTAGYALAAAAGAALGLWLKSATPVTTMLAILAYVLAAFCCWRALDSAYPLSPERYAGRRND